jgi:hypothetical protein
MGMADNNEAEYDTYEVEKTSRSTYSVTDPSGKVHEVDMWSFVDDMVALGISEEDANAIKDLNLQESDGPQMITVGLPDPAPSQSLDNMQPEDLNGGGDFDLAEWNAHMENYKERWAEENGVSPDQGNQGFDIIDNDNGGSGGVDSLMDEIEGAGLGKDDVERISPEDSPGSIPPIGGTVEGENGVTYHIKGGDDLGAHNNGFAPMAPNQDFSDEHAWVNKLTAANPDISGSGAVGLANFIKQVGGEGAIEKFANDNPETIKGLINGDITLDDVDTAIVESRGIEGIDKKLGLSEPDYNKEDFNPDTVKSDPFANNPEVQELAATSPELQNVAYDATGEYTSLSSNLAEAVRGNEGAHSNLSEVCNQVTGINGNDMFEKRIGGCTQAPPEPAPTTSPEPVGQDMGQDQYVVRSVDINTLG